MADGAGAGTFSGTTLRVGSGNAGALRLLLPLLLLFSLLFSFALAVGLISSIASGDTAAFAFAFAFTLAGGTTDPPDGKPSSALPVGGGAGCTG